jgi:DNA-binding NarL/FixJ family response regulator
MEDMMEPLRILLVDDHVLFRKGVAALLASRSEMVVVGEAGDGLEAIATARETVPDVILMDLNMPRCSGLEAVPVIKAEIPQVKIIMLTVSDDDKNVFKAIKLGAEGYILKDLEPQQLFDYLEGTRRGEAAIAGKLAASILREFRQEDRQEPQPLVALEDPTAREWEILEQLVKGASNKDIAAELSISENTVKIHVRNILEKLHLQNRSQAAVYAVRRGMPGETAPRE